MATGTIAITDGKIGLAGGDVTTGKGGDIELAGGNSGGGQSGGAVLIAPGDGGNGSVGGKVEIIAGKGGATSGKGGNVTITSGAAQGGNSDGGDVIITSGAPAGGGQIGKIKIGPNIEMTGEEAVYLHKDVRLVKGDGGLFFRNSADTQDETILYSFALDQLGLLQGSSTFTAALDVSALTDDKVFKFPNYSGEIVNWVSPPASASATGTPGMVARASGFFYVCIATNTWQRVAIATW